MLNELAAGPSLVVALPMYNSLGTMGGFVGPVLVGWLVESSGGSFGVATSMMGIALGTAGVMILGLGMVVKGVGLGALVQAGLSGRAGAGGSGGMASQGASNSKALTRA